MNQVHLNNRSNNGKLGTIPVTTSSAITCPNACPLKGKGCYARFSFLGAHWQAITDGTKGYSFRELLDGIRKLKPGQLWRHNQAGDLQGDGESIDVKALGDLAAANTGRNGYTYTHYPLNTEKERQAVKRANDGGFTVNLSANNLLHADELYDLNIGPVVSITNQEPVKGITFTPNGRPMIHCPATYQKGMTCQKCGICQKSNRKFGILFHVHGSGKNMAASLAV